MKWRPEDQYRNAKAREMIKELKSLRIRCPFSTVKNYKYIMFEGFEHAGVLTHSCSLEKGHEGQCKCNCGVEFRGF